MKSNYIDIIKKTSVIHTERLLLRKFRIQDKEAVLTYGSDPETLKYLVWQGIADLDQAENVIRTYYSRPGIFALELRKISQCIGCIDIRVEPQHEKASFGYVLNRNFWNQGYMTEALQAVLAFCFDRLELNRVEASHYVGNEGSGRVMQKCGMRYEGLSPQEVKVKGVFQDVVHYGITRSQYYESFFKLGIL